MLYNYIRLARIKAEAKRRRDEREKMEEQKMFEQKERMKLLMKQFMEWCVNPSGSVELQLVCYGTINFYRVKVKMTLLSV
jgi:hypothetical protein